MCENVKAPMIEKRLNSEKGRKGDRERKDDEKKKERIEEKRGRESVSCLLYTSPSPRD